ncbi:acyl-CoA dehydratase activase [Desulforamulus hydrothermalis]|uniref:ATPase, activator of (R)-hydroxyglutaryl-CoA dehydratase n=1 Tax=Desulforamulus hydrothermalis Lam5 = DSM 18033 TaxID=1121428 RepID=K8DY01_9FIRM|nr:acyl-CoA dehydratase activase [Desulforamulus hydrothermalis]CCO07515.1 ATPase, activator of (R)-hydroxyglutaryl-CoA dehydratase [Desulforamulus hydrothermalis Lam5 = DSM 18033]SHH16756.1 CoA-substrate-specific enzyme activase, putative [Desulforamulus hydrothermalis Lam5 = DSM 18033]
MIAAGIDVGSVSTKAVLLLDDEIHYLVRPTGWSPREAGWQTYQELLAAAGCRDSDVHCKVGTGYGRVSLGFVDKAVTEIHCHAKGAGHLVGCGGLVIDIGGQDSKAILINNNGKVLDFVMNDKCAAGTGRFLQVIAAALGVDVSELSELARGRQPLEINSMCTVFAESEVISLLAKGEDKKEIIAGLHRSVARRVWGMASRFAPVDKVIFTGGVAKNQDVRERLALEAGCEVIAPALGPLAGALGAALYAREMSAK